MEPTDYVWVHHTTVKEESFTILSKTVFFTGCLIFDYKIPIYKVMVSNNIKIVTSSPRKKVQASSDFTWLHYFYVKEYWTLIDATHCLAPSCKGSLWNQPKRYLYSRLRSAIKKRCVLQPSLCYNLVTGERMQQNAGIPQRPVLVDAGGKILFHATKWFTSQYELWKFLSLFWGVRLCVVCFVYRIRGCYQITARSSISDQFRLNRERKCRKSSLEQKCNSYIQLSLQ